MHIGINGWFYSMPYTGIGQYTVNLVNELAVLAAGKHEITVFCTSESHAGSLPKLPNVRYHTVDKKSRSNDIVDILEFEYLLRKETIKSQIDVLHTPYLCSALLHGNCFKHIVTVHDVIPMVLRKYRGSWIRQLYLWHAEHWINKADLIITDSVHSQTDIHTYLGIPRDRIKVIAISADPVFEQGIEETKLYDVKEKYSLPDEYILYIGGFDFRKNVKTLLEAYAEIRKKGTVETLVLAGKFNPSEKQLKRGLVENIPEIVEDLQLQDFVKFIGAIPQEELPYLYKMAKLFVYPSRYEGFGLPPLEAMMCGTPVLACNRSSIPEIVDREDLLFDPDDPKKLSEKIQRLLADDKLRHSIGEWGIKKARTFSWSGAGGATLDLYEKFCSR